MNIEYLKTSWFVVAQSRQLKKKPLAVTIFDQDIVLFRADGKIVAFLDTCFHRGAPLSKGKVLEGCRLQCPYHGWVYDSEGSISAIPGDLADNLPTPKILRRYVVLEKDGYVWLRLMPGISEPILAAQNDYPNATLTGDWRTTMVDFLENFLDATHTHYVHAGLIRSGDPKSRHRCHVQVRSIENGYKAIYIEEKKQSGIISKLFGRFIDKSIGSVKSPGIVVLDYRSKSASELVLTIHVTPTTKGRCKVFFRLYLKPGILPFWFKIALLFPFQILAFYQDKRILEFLAENLERNPEFVRKIAKTDVMRKCIENVLQGDIKPCEENFYIEL